MKPSYNNPLYEESSESNSELSPSSRSQAAALDRMIIGDKNQQPLSQMSIGGCEGIGIDSELKQRSFLSINDLQTILMNIVSRERFKYSTRDILVFIFTCLCLRKKKKNSYHHLY